MRAFLTLFVVLASGCTTELGGASDPGETSGHFHGEVDLEPPYYDELADSPGLVADQARNCTTQGVLYLSVQLVEEVRCMMPGSLELLDRSTHVEFSGGAVLPFFSPSAITDMDLAASATQRLQINSGLRTVVQQHLIYDWWQEGRCGIPAAARPGSSRHESGRALDLANHGSVAEAMNEHDWQHTVPGDWVHFEHADSADLRGVGVEAFQRLWNRNHPEDPIAEDGDYGTETAERIDRSPAGGFAVGPECGSSIGGEPGPGAVDMDRLEELVVFPDWRLDRLQPLDR